MGGWVGGARGNFGDYHAREEFDLGWFVGIIFIELHDEFKRPILERGICRANNDCIPTKPQLVPIQKLHIKIPTTFPEQGKVESREAGGKGDVTKS